MKASDFLAEYYFHKVALFVDDIKSKSKGFDNFRKLFVEIGEYYGMTRQRSAMTAMQALRSGRFIGKVDKAVVIPIFERLLFACQASNQEPSGMYRAHIAYGPRTIDLEGGMPDIDEARKILRKDTPMWDRFCCVVKDPAGRVIE